MRSPEDSPHLPLSEFTWRLQMRNGNKNVERQSGGKEILVWRSLIILLWIAHVTQ